MKHFSYISTPVKSENINPDPNLMEDIESNYSNGLPKGLCIACEDIIVLP